MVAIIRVVFDIQEFAVADVVEVLTGATTAGVEVFI